jgi:hypothetical protein
VHARPHAPQLAASVFKSRQPLGVAQHVEPAAHAEPPLHVQVSLAPACVHPSPAAHATPPQVQKPFAPHVPVAPL